MEKIIESRAKSLSSTFDEWCSKKYPEKYKEFIKYKKSKLYKLTHPKILAELITTMSEYNKELIEVE